MKILYDRFTMISQLDAKRLEIYLFGGGVTGSVLDWVTDNPNVVWWSLVLVPAAIARLVPTYQSYLDARQNRRVKKMVEGFDLQEKYPEHADEISQELNLNDGTEAKINSRKRK